MLFIRLLEQRIAKKYPEQKMRCPVHLSIGQEAAAVGICSALEVTDQAVSTHRSHAHYLAKGGDPRAFIAELFGKVTGCAKGRGGSMHLIDRSVGFLASTAIVGNSIPVGVGMALSQSMQPSNTALTTVFLGDGALEEGVFYEAANFALVRNLPVLFACENNLYSVYAGLEKRQPVGRTIQQLVEGIGLTYMYADGNNVTEVSSIAAKAVAHIRAGNGPVFIEMPTYRWLEHCGPFDDDHLGYRPKGELADWMQKDPITLEIKQSGISESELNKLTLELSRLVDNIFETAESDPFPDAATVFDGVYSDALVKEAR
ncbi:thiamine pyrophosphate-dependent dehydrogenase E1 component subunit alpha [Leeia sp. TBRC 13508]|uniref:Thiamine pyrophosphate-dependent dehydrogenase E1 component subunit alpha n=1 Tax=Leeia speluncae TaxID=2884804 RepID=A0ABS8D2M3_9NEIS|nr:thiamine pyrophosphate-dependent dehydrogenase E1 component subunit alpha [Leeia speluncae]MCB6182233.1 thiamine pyrophosphate-dependent dehydrogenase E1 component subunit alpha [Leeia speluncae]